MQIIGKWFLSNTLKQLKWIIDILSPANLHIKICTLSHLARWVTEEWSHLNIAHCRVIDLRFRRNQFCRHEKDIVGIDSHIEISVKISKFSLWHQNIKYSNFIWVYSFILPEGAAFSNFYYPSNVCETLLFSTHTQQKNLFQLHIEIIKLQFIIGS